MKIRYLISRCLCGLFLSLLAAGCSELPSDAEKLDRRPVIFPDYTDVTIPVNIAPLNFRLEQEGATRVLFSGKQMQFVVSGNGTVRIPRGKWRALLQKTKAGKVEVTVYQQGKDTKWKAYAPFYFHVSPDSIDSHLTYRLIEPTYANWNEMGIYQRDLSSFDEKEIIANNKTGHNCMNCHAFNRRNPDEMVMHMRKTNPGTILIKDGKTVKLDTKTDFTISNFVYPYWHPAGNDIAFSTNNTQMSFYEAHDKIIEVYDLHSDIVMYNIEQNEVYTSPLLSSPDDLENFPVFSPDGKTLYYCTSPEVDSLPQHYARMQYKLCSIGFDAGRQTFATRVDTLIDLTGRGKGVSLPSVSPDGRYILCSVASCGCFHSWDKESDLYLYNLSNRELRPMDELNSADSDSYSSWSSNSRWVVFSSRRFDGVYNRPFFAHIGADGKAGKPFPLPQEDPAFYESLFKAFNLPQFTTGEVRATPFEIAEAATGDKTRSVKYRQEAHSRKMAGGTGNDGEVN